MELPLYQIDAFAEEVFQGNYAAVCPLEYWLPDAVLQAIASENNLPETAFFVAEKEGFRLRWFTPVAEVRLCGHATLASAHTLFSHLGAQGNMLHFNSLGGQLRVCRSGTSLAMYFPTDLPKPAEIPPFLEEALGTAILDAQTGIDDLLVRVESEELLQDLRPNFAQIAKLPHRGLIVTAPGQNTDFSSRCFFPNLGVDEDPVTGSSHTLLTPYWATLLGKEHLSAVQGSRRKGYLQCQLLGDEVEISGQAKTYLVGKIYI
jgi:PhzF family phenazine biosynthesis protein